MKKYPILLVAWLMPFAARAGTVADALRDKLSEALKTYCVPKDEQTCVNMAARYRNNRCDCGNPAYMKYNRELRKCEVICPAGQMPEKTSGGCQAGYGGIVVKNF
jgi:hypothetical protein